MKNNEILKYAMLEIKSCVYGTEAGLKYLVLGAISSGLFLFGCALLYGGSGDTSSSNAPYPIGRISETTHPTNIKLSKVSTG